MNRAIELLVGYGCAWAPAPEKQHSYPTKMNGGKKKGDRKRRNQRRASKFQVAQATPEYCLSPVSCAYAKLLMDPKNAPLIGVPNGQSVLTKKYRVWARGAVTAGNGTPTNDLSVLVNPWAFLTNSQNAVSFKAGPTAGTLDTTMNGSTTAKGNSPYAAADFSATTKISGRVVACQIKLKFAGTALNKGGYAVSLQEPTHSSLAGLTVNDLLAHTTSDRWNITTMTKDDTITITYRPSDVYDAYFVNAITRTNAYDAVYKSDNVEVGWDVYPFMGCYISCPAASQTFEYECFAAVEFTGPFVPGKSINAPDPQGYAAVLAAINKADEWGAAKYWGKGANSYTAGRGNIHYSASSRGLAGAGLWQTMAAPVLDYANSLIQQAVPVVATTAGRMVGAAAIRAIQAPRAPRILELE